jgi:phosphoribosylglycinamide formyltransferase 1
MVSGDTLTGPAEPKTHGRVVLLAGPGTATDIVANFLHSRVAELVVIVENPPSRLHMARRRARRVGWLSAVGQVLFVAALNPVLRYQGARRRADITRAASLDTTHRAPDHSVPSVNDEETRALLVSLRPTAVVVQGTRIIGSRLLDSVDCPLINMHAGITPRYRGVHGGYWALAEQHPEWVGTTVHLVDPGIDTGGVLAQATFDVSDEDSIATYPDLHLVHGLPLLGAEVDKVMAGRRPEPKAEGLAPGSGLYYHPTLWGYLLRRWRHGVR